MVLTPKNLDQAIPLAKLGHKLGNSSVATIPTLYDSIVRGEIENQSLHKGDVILFASVGAGMNVNAIVYKM